MKALPFMMMCGFVASVNATSWYVDSRATGSKSGTSWADAWTNVDQISGVSAGDTVYISGGPAGSSRTYALGADWHPVNGTGAGVITYQIGQDASHNGTAIFSVGANSWVSGAISYVKLSGDAGDGAQHFQVSTTNNGTVVDASNSISLRVSYVKVPTSPGSFAYFNGGDLIEIDHIYFNKSLGASTSDDRIIYFGVGTVSAFDRNLIHHCEFYAPRSGDGDGDDFVQSGNNGISVYNNKFVGVAVTSYPRGQHQDGWQPLAGDHYKFYNNFCQDIANYACFGDAYYGNLSYFYVYNNIVVLTDPTLQNGNAPQGIAIGPDGGAFANLGHQPSFDHIIIANNLIDGYQNKSGISLWNPTTHPTTFSNCVVDNNIDVNTSGNTIDPAVQALGNVAGITTAQAQSDFVSYSVNGSNNNYHLLKTSSLFGKGMNLSSYFSTDKDGKLRAPTGVWDIGPYVYNAYNVPPPPANLRVVTP